MKRLTRPLSITPPIGPQHELIMAMTAQQYTQDACGTGSGPFAALGFAEVTRDLHGLEFRPPIALFCLVPEQSDWQLTFLPPKEQIVTSYW